MCLVGSLHPACVASLLLTRCLCPDHSTEDADLVFPGDVRADMDSYYDRLWLVSFVFLLLQTAVSVPLPSNAPPLSGIASSIVDFHKNVA
jgi:hypothetical protein